MPAAISPRRARSAKPSTFSMYQASFGAVKYESLFSPVRERTCGSSPSARQRRTMESVCFDIHITALCTGSPVRRSHANAVSRWVVTPTAAMSAATASTWAIARRMLSSCACHSATGSSSTQPGRGKSGTVGLRASATMRPSGSTSTVRALVDPRSSAIT